MSIKRGKSPKKENQWKIQSALFSYSSQHKKMSPRVSTLKQAHNLTTTMQPALKGLWQAVVSLAFKRLINITEVDCRLLVPALMPWKLPIISPTGTVSVTSLQGSHSAPTGEQVLPRDLHCDFQSHIKPTKHHNAFSAASFKQKKL